MAFRKATKSQKKLRLALSGASGSGKTYSALGIAMGLLEPGQRIAVIDTERGSSELYADRFDFDVCELATFAPDDYLRALQEAEAAGAGVIIVDSLSHAWSATGGILEIVDQAGKSGGHFSGWKTATPIQNKFIDRLFRSPAHLICTMRSETEWVVEPNDKGKMTPRKVGTKPVQKNQIDYEFDVYGEMDVINQVTITKTRCAALAGQQFMKPGADLSRILLAWLNTGVPIAATTPATEGAPPGAAPEQTTTAPAEVKPFTAPQTARERLRGSIRAAATLAQLEALIPDIKRLPNVDLESLKPDYGKRQAELKQPAQQAVAPPPAPLPTTDAPPSAFLAPPEASHSGLIPPEIRRAMNAAASVQEAEAALAKADPNWDAEVLEDLRNECEEIVSRLKGSASAPTSPPAPREELAMPPAASSEFVPVPVQLPVPVEVAPPQQASKPPLDRKAELQVSVAFEKAIRECASISAVQATQREISASRLNESSKNILADECNQRIERIQSDAQAPSTDGGARVAERAKEHDAMVARFYADIDQSLASGHPAQARAAKINSKRAAGAGEITATEAMEIGEKADKVLKTCEAKEKKA